jgi:hypothetical protein
MREGWHGNTFIAVFEGSEASAFAEACDFQSGLPGYSLIGLRGWQDFIVQDQAGVNFTIPTVPLDPQYITPFTMPDPVDLEEDARFTGKVQWLLKPLVFGASGDDKDNETWVTYQQHSELVRWWNQQYWAAKARV